MGISDRNVPSLFPASKKGWEFETLANRAFSQPSQPSHPVLLSRVYACACARSCVHVINQKTLGRLGRLGITSSGACFELPACFLGWEKAGMDGFSSGMSQ